MLPLSLQPPKMIYIIIYYNNNLNNDNQNIYSKNKLKATVLGRPCICRCLETPLLPKCAPDVPQHCCIHWTTINTLLIKCTAAVHAPDDHNVQVFMAHWHIGQAEAVHKVDAQPQILAQLHVEGLCAGVLLGQGREQGALQTHLHNTQIRFKSNVATIHLQQMPQHSCKLLTIAVWG